MCNAALYLIVRLAAELGSGMPPTCETDADSKYDVGDCVLLFNADATKKNAYDICCGMTLYNGYVGRHGLFGTKEKLAAEYFSAYFRDTAGCPGSSAEEDLLPAAEVADELFSHRVYLSGKHRRRWRRVDEFGCVSVCWYDKTLCGGIQSSIVTDGCENACKKITPQMIRGFYSKRTVNPRGWEWDLFC